ncbi:hypothetical protein GA0070620_5730 [Micromonospora krabiensis]|uniref:Uncharacterized protein n=1 Tax=Micromonospora krabiensis TaxID=307121 RepID=A0A1C3NC06_9ACTN|nr:hypothetical protein GA0070620_5730 [Micromonospora krabiensis]
MPMDDGPVTPALALWTARRVIAQHSAPGRCAQCRDDGCGMLTWARAVTEGQS